MTSDPDDFADREEEIVELPDSRIRVIRIVNTLIRFLTGLFALVLVLHIVLVAAGANFGNAFASFVRSFADAVSLGLNNLFTFTNDSLELAANQGLAAVLWLIIGAALTALITGIFLPGGGGTRVVRRRKPE
ncbi:MULTISPECIES: hypothetical protein [Thermocrispum]|jgi:hypothetical protein|uniref:Uncharacterized protein n=1 Tax=Thermocrispum agreste TaxID=37925 RepID=A0A2W4JRA6_9PSEU|nr:MULTISPECIES: hypothetical protein [Thermocrispum]PZN00932.1 MAG: hypothetical protein DIU77_02260 [Thermocrispum agreste]